MNERIKRLRKSLGFTQMQFAQKLGLKQNTIACYEKGRIKISDAVIFSICREFDVSEDWLRNGIGEMFIELTDEEAIAMWAAEVLKDNKDAFRRRVVKMLMAIPSGEWEKIAEYAKILFESENEEIDNKI